MSETIIKLAKDCLENGMDRESENWKRAEEAINFRALKQWPDAVKSDRENPNQEGGPRPCPVLDKTNQYVRQVINEERQNRAAIKIRPVDDKADKQVADVYTGIIRHIEDSSDALTAYTTGGEHAADGGFGYWRLLTEYCDPMSFDQDIKIKRIPNRFSVILGPHAEPDGSDAQEGIIWEDMQTSDFKASYPKAKVLSFNDGHGSWVSKDTTRIAEYMRIETTKATIHMLGDGQVVNDERLASVNAGLKQRGLPEVKPVKSRQTNIKQVKWYKITAAEVLEERDLLGSYIPIVKVIGNELFMPDGRCRTSGMLETAMDPQRLHNYAHAGFIEHVALAPRAPWIAEENQVKGYENEYGMANRRNIALLKYKATTTETGQPLPPPERIQPAGISTGWQQMLMNTEHGIEASFGMYGPSVGAKSQEKSGIALQEQKAQGMVGNYHFPDNLARSIRHTGRILLEWIPKIYDTQRAARILGEDGVPDMAYLNPEQDQAVAPRKDQWGEEVGSVYNLNVGTYDVTVSTGPSWTSKRQEGAEMLSQTLASSPDIMPVIGDLYFKALDVPYADQIAERLRVMLPPQVQQMLASEDKKPMDPKVTAAMAQVDQASQMLEQKGQVLQQAQQEIEKAAQQVGQDRASFEAEKQSVQAEKQAIASAKQVLSAETQKSMAQIELAGRRLIDEIESLIEPLVQKVNTPMEKEQKEPQTIVVQDPALQEVLRGVAELTASATEHMAETVNQALQGVAQAVSRPRETILKRDANGNAIGSISQ